MPRVVVIAGIASLLTDLSTEMIYPLLPVFLTAQLGATALALGLIEGVAETTAAVLKIVSGVWTDRLGKRKPLMVFGYTISGLARPLIGLAVSWPQVLVIRFLDRTGKGLRGTPRDALIADVVPRERRGAAFGFHRMMDNAGAVLGPIVAWALLALSFEIRTVFLLALIPGVLVMLLLIFGLKEEPIAPRDARASIGLREGWALLDTRYKLLLLSIFVFALGMSADAFILMRFTEAGFGAGAVALLWAMHQAVKSVTSYWGGGLSDRVGRRRVVLAGWMIYAAVYLAFGLVSNSWVLVAVFMVYGLYFGLVEPSEKAWVADLAPRELHGTAMGYYNGVLGLSSLPADLMFGFVWYQFGSGAAFGMGAAFAGIGAAMLLLLRTGGGEGEVPEAEILVVEKD